MGTKYIDIEWDFRGADTKKYSHCFHSYPAMMIPQIAKRLLEQFGQSASLLFDPYCGTGTSLVEANLNSINAIGTDLNPLARLIAKVKTTLLDINILDSYLKQFSDYCLQIDFGKKIDVDIPNFNNIDYWFDMEVLQALAKIKKFIDKIEIKDIADFFRIVFSETVRESSWTRNSEFKLYRMNDSQRDRFNPNVFAIMQNKLNRNRKGLFEYMQAKKDGAFSTVYSFNTVDDIPQNILSKGMADIVVTSPPYGDSRTTVAYGQFSRLANQWLGVDNANQIDRLLMGGISKEIKCFEIDILDDVINEIANIDIKRAKDVSAFYWDYRQSIFNVANVTKKDGFACYVVGNRRVKGISLPTDEITKLLFEQNGFVHIETIVRNIPNKRMPNKNSPTNKVGKVGATITKEHIVVMKKQ